MFYFSILYHIIILYYIILYFIIFYYIILYYIILFYFILFYFNVYLYVYISITLIVWNVLPFPSAIKHGWLGNLQTKWRCLMG